MKLVIDLRRAFDSGLGTYIRHVVPASVAQLRGIRAVGLIAPGDEARHASYWGSVNVSFQPITAAPLSLAEQWALRRACPAEAVFWATTLSHALWSPRRLVATVHDVAQLALPSAAGISVPVRLASRLFFSSLRRSAELLMFNSHFTASEFKRYVGNPQVQTAVTPLGVDRAQWQFAKGSRRSAQPVSAAWSARTGGAPYFLWLGNLRPHKNLPLLLRAFEAVASALPHHLLVVGRAPQGHAAEAWVQQVDPPFRTRVHVLGEVAAEELPALMHQASALVMPSQYEGFGLPVLEAFAAGCPVLASRIGALLEVGGEAAQYFDASDHHALAKLLLEIAAWSEADRAAWVDAGLSRAQLQPWHKTAQLTAVALQAVLDSPRGALRKDATFHLTKE
jgi:glycosyltransferase involved in cell wall biosynthesis